MSAPKSEAESPADSARTALEAVRAEIAKAVVGQDPVVTGLVIALLCRGHVCWKGFPVSPRPCWSAPSQRRSNWRPSGCSSRPT